MKSLRGVFSYLLSKGGGKRGMKRCLQRPGNSFPSRLSAKLSLHDLSGYEKLLEDNTDYAKFPVSTPDPVCF